MQGGGGIDAGISARLQCKARAYGNGAMMIAYSVLILEDSLIIAMEAEEILRESGAETVNIVSNVEQALATIAVEHYDFALLDVNLGDSMSFDFARTLRERGIRFGFVSGYSNTADFPSDMQDVPLLVKPFDEVAMQHFLAKLASKAP